MIGPDAAPETEQDERWTKINYSELPQDTDPFYYKSYAIHKGEDGWEEGWLFKDGDGRIYQIPFDKLDSFYIDPNKADALEEMISKLKEI